MSEQEVWALMSEAEELPPGPAQVAVLEAAVRHADATQDDGLSYEARSLLIRAAVFGGCSERAITALSWCLAKSDKDPERFPVYNLMWQYKWIVPSLPEFPTISREQILRMVDDFASRTDRLGWGTRTVEYLRWKVAFDMGDFDVAADCYKSWKKLKRDQNSDCHACETDAVVEFLIIMGQDEDALQAAQPIFNGSLGCAEVPEVTHGIIITPLLRLGRVEEAGEHFQSGYRKVSRNPEFLETVGRFMIYLIRADRLNDAARLFRKHLSWSLASREGLAKFRFDTAAALFLERLAESRKKFKAQLPESFPGYQESGQYITADLAAELRRGASDLAAQFDRRNGNDYYSRQLDEMRLLAFGPAAI